LETDLIQAIQLATASEPLTLDEEFSMQQSWREDSDKLTFIICKPLPDRSVATTIKANTFDSSSEMIGDVNMFISMDKEKLEDGQVEIIGELELMVAESKQQHNGYGRSALLTFLYYVLANEKTILAEFLESHTEVDYLPSRFSCFSAKIGKDNTRSLSLFESLAFKKVFSEPNFFGEFELRHDSLTLETVETMMAERSVCKYQEIEYEHMAALTLACERTT